MRHPFFIAPRPLVFAHRGGAGLRPENTLAAFEHGLAVGADGFELDVRLSRDGVVMVHHDATLVRTTNLCGRVADYDARPLEQADAACHFQAGSDRPFRGAGVGVPRLAAVLERFPGVRVIVELKQNCVELARAVVAVVRAAGAEERVCVGCYGLRAMREVRALAPEIATSAAREEVRWALYCSWARWPVWRPRYAGFQVPERAGPTRVVSPRFVAAAHAAGLAVQVWTIDRENDARRLLAWGVDGLITDRPDRLVPIVAGENQRAQKS